MKILVVGTLVLLCVVAIELGVIIVKLNVTDELIGQSTLTMVNSQDEMEGVIERVAEYPYCPKRDPFGIFTDIRCMPVPANQETPSIVN